LSVLCSFVFYLWAGGSGDFCHVLGTEYPRTSSFRPAESTGVPPIFICEFGSGAPWASDYSRVDVAIGPPRWGSRRVSHRGPALAMMGADCEGPAAVPHRVG